MKFNTENLANAMIKKEAVNLVNADALNTFLLSEAYDYGCQSWLDTITYNFCADRAKVLKASTALWSKK